MKIRELMHEGIEVMPPDTPAVATTTRATEEKRIRGIPSSTKTAT
ncbi:MAG: hypothetical protein M5U16_11955 [Hyphomicrobium sp.]|nr:hypothetical protein [Hyphomicrobium sp.]